MFIFGEGILATKVHPISALKIFMFFFVGGLVGLGHYSDRRLAVPCTACYWSRWLRCCCMRWDFRSSIAT